MHQGMHQGMHHRGGRCSLADGGAEYVKKSDPINELGIDGDLSSQIKSLAFVAAGFGEARSLWDHLQLTCEGLNEEFRISGEIAGFPGESRPTNCRDAIRAASAARQKVGKSSELQLRVQLPDCGIPPDTAPCVAECRRDSTSSGGKPQTVRQQTIEHIDKGCELFCKARSLARSECTHARIEVETLGGEDKKAQEVIEMATRKYLGRLLKITKARDAYFAPLLGSERMDDLVGAFIEEAKKQPVDKAIGGANCVWRIKNKSPHFFISRTYETARELQDALLGGATVEILAPATERSAAPEQGGTGR